MNFDLLKRLCETPGIPSREEPIRGVIVEELKPLSDSVSLDPMGNLIEERDRRAEGHDRGPYGRDRIPRQAYR